MWLIIFIVLGILYIISSIAYIKKNGFKKYLLATFSLFNYVTKRKLIDEFNDRIFEDYANGNKLSSNELRSLIESLLHYLKTSPEVTNETMRVYNDNTEKIKSILDIYNQLHF